MLGLLYATENQELALGIRVALALVLLIAGALKIVRPSLVLVDDEADGILGVLSASGVPIVLSSRILSRGLPVVEVAMALWLVSRWQIAAALISTGIMFFAFAVVMLRALRRGYEGSCSCFGSASGRLGISSVVFATLLLLSAVAAAGVEMSQTSTSTLDVRSITDDGIYVSMLLVSFVIALKRMVQEVEGTLDLRRQLVEPTE